MPVAWKTALAIVDQDDLQVRHVGEDRHEVLCRVLVDDAAVAVVQQRPLHQRHPQAHDGASQDLAAGHPRIDDPARRLRAHEPLQPHLAGVRIDVDLGEPGPEGVRGEARHLVAGPVLGDGFELREVLALQHLGEGAGAGSREVAQPRHDRPAGLEDRGADARRDLRPALGLSPSCTSTWAGVRPRASAAIWVSIVYVPVPMSVAAVWTTAVPSASNRTRAAAGERTTG